MTDEELFDVAIDFVKSLFSKVKNQAELLKIKKKFLRSREMTVGRFICIQLMQLTPGMSVSDFPNFQKSLGFKTHSCLATVLLLCSICI